MISRLILHVGLPKTGSSSLQRWLDQNRANLRQQGINYPETGRETVDPKHQFIVTGLLTNGLHRFQDVIAENRCPTLLLSAEGLTNHLYDFDPEALSRFRELTCDWPVDIVAVVRERDAWVKSYYKQAVTNPPSDKYDYATALDLSTFSKLPRVQRLCAHEKLRADLATSFAARHVLVLKYEQDYLGGICDFVEIGSRDKLGELPRANLSLSDDLVELVRQVNAMGLEKDARGSLLAAFQICMESDHIGLKHFYNTTLDNCETHINARAAVEALRPNTRVQQMLVEKLRHRLQSDACTRRRTASTDSQWVPRWCSSFFR